MKTDKTETKPNTASASGRIQRLVRWLDKLTIWLTVGIMWRMTPRMCQTCGLDYSCLYANGVWLVRIGVGRAAIADSRKEAHIRANMELLYPSNSQRCHGEAD